MTRVVLIRPGSTDYDEQDRIQGVLDIPLNARGSEEAAQTAEALKETPLNRVYSSAEESAYETARAIGKALSIRVRRLEKLHNLNQGLWQGLKVDEVRHKHPRVYRQWCESPVNVCPPGGETISDTYLRVSQVLKSVLKRHRDETIGLVAPEPLACVVRCYLRRIDLASVWETRETGEENGRWQVIEVITEQAPSGS